MTKGENTIIYVMGVSGCGKSTIGQKLATKLNLPFADGDDFHPAANVEKMQSGQALNDADRADWLAAIHAYAKKQSEAGGAVIACSALKQKYRRQLSKGLESQVAWVYLQGSFDLINQRMQARKDHFMPIALLRSQFETLEEPEQAITVDISMEPASLVEKICNDLINR